MTHYIIKHITKGLFLYFDEERATPIFSKETDALQLAKKFPTHGLALYERMRWHNNNRKKQISYVRIDPTQSD